MHAGIFELQIYDELKSISFPVLVLYPTEAQPATVVFDGLTHELSLDAPISAGKFPLVIISHGIRGRPFLYRSIAAHLAKQGYVVAMIRHHGNNDYDPSLGGSLENLEMRPRHVSLCIDSLSSQMRLKNSFQVDNVAVIGHSMGGYTALAVAGGQAFLGRSTSGKKVEIVPDKRIKAIVLMACVSNCFIPSTSLQAVNIPILLYQAGQDKITPRWHSQLILDYVPDKTKVVYELIEDAGHYSFVSPFTEEIKPEDAERVKDPNGFDRKKFHNSLNEKILLFLNKHMK